jgi:hypothetical protein
MNNMNSIMSPGAVLLIIAAVVLFAACIVPRERPEGCDCPRGEPHDPDVCDIDNPR